ncbi:GNAT family N-acetyltransferase [Marinimicrococcus flavescens]|uniref:GNAT family N-acetyltransferase n=1 Tax=Marinimicrococcus flavescens TaxID=3031815 RepID=A0AAP3UZB6_9PROT|nr:GNAT family N-acetyltransferase [Marinimicrococcus flavescens]
MSHAVITMAADPDRMDEVRRLFRDYSGEVDAPMCFEAFDRELDTLPGEYAAPGGALLLATEGGVAIGCAALRRIDGESCEMRRLFVDTQHRRTGVGMLLVQAAIARAGRLGYRRLELETVPERMPVADAIYARLGFVESGRRPDGVVRRALDLARPDRDRLPPEEAR